MHSPDAVQHCAAILLPAGVAMAAGEVMQTPLERASVEPERAITPLKGGGEGAGGGGEGDGGGGEGEGAGGGDGEAGDGGDGHDSPVHTYAKL